MTQKSPERPTNSPKKVQQEKISRDTPFYSEIPDEELEKVAGGCGDSTMTEGKIK